MSEINNSFLPPTYKLKIYRSICQVNSLLSSIQVTSPYFAGKEPSFLNPSDTKNQQRPFLPVSTRMPHYTYLLYKYSRYPFLLHQSFSSFLVTSVSMQQSLVIPALKPASQQLLSASLLDLGKQVSILPCAKRFG